MSDDHPMIDPALESLAAYWRDQADHVMLRAHDCQDTPSTHNALVRQHNQLQRCADELDALLLSWVRPCSRCASTVSSDGDWFRMCRSCYDGAEAAEVKVAETADLLTALKQIEQQMTKGVEDSVVNGYQFGVSSKCVIAWRDSILTALQRIAASPAPQKGQPSADDADAMLRCKAGEHSPWTDSQGVTRCRWSWCEAVIAAPQKGQDQ